MGWINSISQGIEKAFDTVRPAAQAIPALLLLCEISRRPGISAIALTAAIIRRLPEAGIETGVNADGSQNKICQFVRIMSEEIVTEIKDNMKINCVVAPGALISSGVGANAGGPVTVISTNTMPTSVDGIAR